MLTVVSPAKRLNFGPARTMIAPTEPAFGADAIALSKTARRLSVAKLRALMGISEDLARLNRDRFRAFDEAPLPEATKPAALAFAGDTYLGLEAATLDAEEMVWAQDRLRILSGLYGLLRPMDKIQAYRLEMGSRLATRRGKTLYQYWGGRIAKALNETAEQTGAKVLVNCASVEYFKAVDPAVLTLPVVTPVFLDTKGGEVKIISFFAKKARGAMARFIVQNRIVEPDGIRDFDIGGYRYWPERSTQNGPVFIRDEGA